MERKSVCVNQIKKYQIEHEIPTTVGPWVSEPHRVAPAQKNILEGEILIMEKKDTITKITGP